MHFHEKTSAFQSQQRDFPPLSIVQGKLKLNSQISPFKKQTFIHEIIDFPPKVFLSLCL